MSLRLLPRHSHFVLAAGFLVGLAAKLVVLGDAGMPDMVAYQAWGEAALASGLATTYHGIYFPLQYQLFELTAWIARESGASFPFVLRACNLVFDTVTFIVLLRLFAARGTRPAYALLYWLHPCFLTLFALGYADFQFACCVVVCLLALDGDSTRDYLTAGVPLGLAFLMKPQAQVLIVAAFLLSVFRYGRRGEWRPFALLVFPSVLFLTYEVYFAVALFPQLGDRALTELPRSYLSVVNALPALAAQFPNAWYPVAYAMKDTAEPIYAVSDQLRLVGIPIKYLAAATVLALLTLFVSRIERAVSLSPRDQLGALFAFSSLLVPFVMTSAHENHLFLGAVFLVLLLGTRLPRVATIAIHALLTVQFLNLSGLYAERPAWLAQLFRHTYSGPLVVAYAVIATIGFVVVARHLWRQETL